MSFNDIDFILKFLPIFLIAYLLVPNKFKNWIIVIGTGVFYGLGGIYYLPVLVLMFVINFLFAKYFVGRRKFVCALGIGINVCLMLGLRLTGFQVPALSFVLMEMIALLVDVCRGKESVTNIKEFATFFFFFPKLMSGPITMYGQLKNQIGDRVANLAAAEEGLGIFIIGLSYKVLLADQLKGVWGGINQIGIESISVPMAWFGLLAISLNIYFDFQGYSLMAIGAGRILGFTLPENFDSPYTSKSISEFYRRWHMTLGAWFKNYIYIPLGGSRTKLPRTLFNIFVVWVATSVWHGFKLHLFAWGMLLCAFILLEKLFLAKLCNKLKVLPHIYVLLVIAFSWMLFSVGSMREAYEYVLRLIEPLRMLFGYKPAEHINMIDVYKHLSMYAPFTLVGIVLCMPKVEGVIRKNISRWWGKIFALVLLFVCLYILHLNESNPFAYFLF